ncbi:MAG: Ig-like domain-containing protein, partial [Verrucomicrobiota bacterium]
MDTIWSGTIYISGDVTLSAGITLTLQPGTVVKFQQGASLSISSTLLAAGTSTSKIIFTSARDASVGLPIQGAPAGAAQAGDWESLYFEAGSDLSVLSQAEVRFAGNAANPGNTSWYRPAVRLNRTGATLTDVVVQDADWDGIELRASAATLTRVAVNRARFLAFTEREFSNPILRELSATNNGTLNGYWFVGGSLSSNRIFDFGGLAVYVSSDTAIDGGATLTIVPGQVVKFAQGASLTVNTGFLTSLGTATSKIIFTSFKDDSVGGDANADAAVSSPQAGDWEAIYFEAGSDQSVLSQAEVRFAGNAANPGNSSWYRPAIRLTNTSATLTDVLVIDADQNGVEIVGGSPVLTRVLVTRARALAFAETALANPTLRQLSASNTGLNGYWFVGGTLTANRTFDFGGLPGFINNNLTVAAGTALTLIPGLVVKFRQGVDLEVDGTLNAVGAADNKIIFTSFKDDSVGGDTNADVAASTPQSGDWQAIYFRAGSDASVLDQVEVRFAGNAANPGNSSWYRPAVRVTGSNAKLSDVLIRDADFTGVDILTSNPSLTRVTVDKGRSDAFTVDLVSNPTLVSLVASNNGGNRVLKLGGTFSNDQVWDGGGLPIELTGSLTIPQDRTLTIAPGQVIKLRQAVFIDVNKGRLIADSTAALPIVFTSVADDTAGGDSNADGNTSSPVAGNWQAIFLTNATADTILRNVDIRYPGNAASPGNASWFRYALTVQGTDARLENLRIVQADWRGVRLQDASSPTLINVSVTNAREFAFVSDFTVTPSLSNIAASSNGRDAFFFDGGALPTSRRWSLINMPYIFNNSVTVPVGITLTLDPGVVLKWNTAQYLQINGTLSAVGTAAVPIVLTSRRDDTALGDTFRDGSDGAAAPQRGDWQSLFIESDSTGTVLDNVDIRYPGNAASPGNASWFRPALRLNAATTVIRTRIFEADWRGIEINGTDVAPTLDTVTIDGVRAEAIHMSLMSNPTFRGLRSTRTGGDRIQIGGGTLDANRTWDGSGLPFHLETSLTLPAGRTLTLVPGTVVKLPQAAFVSIAGTLNANASSGAPIVFTALSDDSAGGDSNADGVATLPVPGSWQGIFIDGTASSATVLNNAQIRYAGNAASPGNASWFRPTITLSGGTTAVLRNVMVAQGDWRGLRIASSNPTLDTITVTDHNSHPIWSELSSDPAITNFNAARNGANAFLMDGGTLPDPSNNTTNDPVNPRRWSITNLPYEIINSSLVIPAGSSLTLDPGVVVKMHTANYIDVSGGTLIAAGTSASPVILTTFTDDSALGSIDGTASVGRAGEWHGLIVEANSKATLNNLEVRYAGNAASPGNGSWFRAAVYLRSPASVDNLTVRDSDSTGISIENGAAITLTNSRVLRSGVNDGNAWAVNVVNGSLTATGLNISGGRNGVRVPTGGTSSAFVTGSSFTGLAGTAASNGANDLTKFVATGSWWGDAGGPNDPSNADSRQNVNAAGQNVSDWVDYSNFLTTRPALPGGLRVISQTPTLTNTSPESLTIDFSGPVQAGTLTNARVTITGPAGLVVPVTTITSNSATQFVLGLPVGLGPGTYRVVIDSQVLDPQGFPMDSAYNGTLVIDNVAPTVTAQTPTGTATSSFSQIVLTFSEPMDATTVTAAAALLTSPDGPVRVLSVTALSPTQFAFGVPQQFTNGAYAFALTATVRDRAGNPLAADYSGAFTLQRVALRIIAQSPTGPINTPLSSLDVTFNAAILAASFTPLAVQIQGPLGAVTATAVTQVSPTVYRIAFLPQFANGTYTFAVGPAITDPAGIAMDQNGDGAAGTFQDRYLGTVVEQNVGPTILSQTPTGTVAAGITFVDVTFGAPIRPETFTPDRATLSAPDNTLIPILSVVGQTATTYRINFAPQIAAGAYTLTVGPQIFDLAGNAMPAPYTGSFRVDATPPFVTGSNLSGTLNVPFSSLTITFNKDIDAATFATAQVKIIGPGGPIIATAVNRIDARNFQIVFAPQNSEGTFNFTIGPDIHDLAGNRMDQNLNGTAGETADSYVLSLTLVLPNLVPEGFTVPATVALGLWTSALTD